MDLLKDNEMNYTITNGKVKLETKIKQIKNNYWNYRKNIVFKIKLKYNKSILFIEEIFVEGGEHFEFIRFNLAINCFIIT